ncbi:MAG: hypothetical protein K2Y28_13190 [Burkholderiaceae bacterium]|nr:hypothetical protein [Burkholderiaceae bacterium]
MADIFKKLNLKDQTEIVVLHAPESFEAELGSLQNIVVHRKLKPQHALQFGLAFVTQEKVLDEVSAAMTKQAKGDALIWIAYPKKSSKKYHCEFNRDSEWRVLSEAGYETVRMVAIDEDWSALRFRKSAFVGK